MNVLALDTCMRACSAAVLGKSRAGGRVFRAYEDRDRGHAEVIMPMIEQVMGEAGLDYASLDRIAVTVGPGTFTGVRVGVSAARGLALATGADLIGVSSLEVIAARALERFGNGSVPVAVAVDARRGQVYFAAFAAGLTPACDPVALAPGDAAARLPTDRKTILVGSGGPMIAESGCDIAAERVLGDMQPDAATLARLAVQRAPGDETVSPLYLRPPDAKPQTGVAVARR